MDQHVFLHRNIYFTVNQVTIIQNVSSKTKSVSVDIRQQKRNISRHFILFFFISSKNKEHLDVEWQACRCQLFLTHFTPLT